MAEPAATLTPEPPEPVAPEPVRDAPVHVVSPWGEVGTVPASAFANAKREGYTLATPQQIERTRKEEVYGGTLGTIGAVAGGAVEAALPFSLGTRLLTALPGGREQLQAYKEIAPGASLAGELAGGLGLLAATGGLATPAEGAAAGLGLGRTAATVAGQAAEAAAFGASAEMSRAALAEEELQGEQLFDAMGHGALLGGGTALGLAGLGAVGRRTKGAIGRLLTKPEPAAIEAAAQQIVGVAQAPKGLGGHVLERYRAAARAMGADPRAVDVVLAGGPEGDAVRDLLFKRGQSARDDIAAGLADDIDRVANGYEVVANAARGEMKKSHLDRIIRHGNEAETAAAASEAFRGTYATIDDMIADPVIYGGKKTVTRLKALREQVQRYEYESLGISRVEVTRAATAGDVTAADIAINNTDRAMALDRTKRIVGDFAKEFGESAKATSRRDLQTVKERLMAQAYEPMRATLEKEGLWGGAAEWQKLVNEYWSEQISGRATGHLGSWRQFQKHFTTWVTGDLGGKVTYADRGKVKQYVQGLLDPTRDHAHIALREAVANTRKFGQAVRQMSELSPEQMAAVAKLESASKSIAERVAKGTDEAVKFNLGDLLQAADREGAMLNMGVLGGVLGGVPGAIVGAAASAVASPYATARRLAALKSISSRVSSKLEQAGSAWVKGAARAGRAARGLPRAVAPGVLAAERYEERRKKVEAATAVPRAELQQQAAAVAPDAPGAQAAIVATAGRAAQHLASTMPLALPRGLGPARTPSRTEREAWERRARAVEDPASVLADARAGKVSREAIEALRTVYPRRYEALRAGMAEELTRRAADGKGLDMPYGERIQLGLLLDLPTDPTLDPELMAAVAATYTPAGEAAQQQGATPTPQKAPDVARHFIDASERLEREEV